jgi:hypothetical protein
MPRIVSILLRVAAPIALVAVALTAIPGTGQAAAPKAPAVEKVVCHTPYINGRYTRPQIGGAGEAHQYVTMCAFSLNGLRNPQHTLVIEPMMPLTFKPAVEDRIPLWPLTLLRHVPRVQASQTIRSTGPKTAECVLVNGRPRLPNQSHPAHAVTCGAKFIQLYPIYTGVDLILTYCANSSAYHIGRTQAPAADGSWGIPEHA